jgi:hypothetical protein
MPNEKPTTTNEKLDAILSMIAAESDPHASILRMIENVNRRQEQHISDNGLAHRRLESDLGSMTELVTGNGKVGLAEEVRILKRGYHAILWLGGVVASGVVIQTLIVVREHISSTP